MMLLLLALVCQVALVQLLPSCSPRQPRFRHLSLVPLHFWCCLVRMQVDATAKENEEAKSKFKIGGFPTIKARGVG